MKKPTKKVVSSILAEVVKLNHKVNDIAIDQGHKAACQFIGNNLSDPFLYGFGTTLINHMIYEYGEKEFMRIVKNEIRDLKDDGVLE